MGSLNRRTTLRDQIADVLGKRVQAAPTGQRTSSRQIARKSIACSSMMMLAVNPAPVGAVGLGDMELNSRLGEPLEATVPLNLGAGESLPKNCVQPAPAGNGLGAPPGLQVASPSQVGPGTYQVRISTTNALHEPMYELSLMVQCPGAALLVRQYILLLDLPGMPMAGAEPAPAGSPIDTTTAAPKSQQQRDAATPATKTRRDPARALPPRADGIPAGSVYRVSRGDTLSTIARRVQGRPADTTWPVARRIFGDNPTAFIRNDPDLIKLGSLIRIPDNAVLAAMVPGPRQLPMPAVVATAPAPASAVVSRGEAALAGRTPVTPSRPAETPEPQPASANLTETAAPPEAEAVAEPAVTAETSAGTEADASTFYPFAEEPAPEPTTVNTAAPTEVADNAAGAPAPVVARADEPRQPAQPSALLSILIGLLIGGAVSLFAFRDRLLAPLGRRRRPQPLAARRAAGSAAAAGRSSGYDASLAAAAFDRTEDHVEDAAALPIGHPAEATYIVETAEAEPTVREDAENLHPPEPARATDESGPVAARADAAAAEDGTEELAKLFDDDATDGSTINEPTAEMPQHRRAETDATAQMEQAGDDSLFDPATGLPPDALDQIFDPTGGLDDSGMPEIESTLMQAFDEDLDNLDPEDAFPTVNHEFGDIAGESQVEPLDVTVNDPLEDTFVDDPTAAGEPAAELSIIGDGDDDLSETLHEALALLERDYEDEFTASQILERSALEKSLREDLEQQEAEPEDETVERKIS
ncbi:MAG: FimV family protein [Gammaproteobacteria bacterium]